MRADGQVCFRLPTGESAPAFGLGLLLRLRDVYQEALADLLQILACGEESAALAFESLSHSRPSAEPCSSVAEDDENPPPALQAIGAISSQSTLAMEWIPAPISKSQIGPEADGVHQLPGGKNQHHPEGHNPRSQGQSPELLHVENGDRVPVAGRLVDQVGAAA